MIFQDNFANRYLVKLAILAKQFFLRPLGVTFVGLLVRANADV
nr:hypothetical protein [Dawidia cretensis]